MLIHNDVLWNKIPWGIRNPLSLKLNVKFLKLHFMGKITLIHYDWF